MLKAEHTLQAYSDVVAEFDLSSGVKLGSTESPDPIVVLQYTADATTLIGLSRACPPNLPFCAACILMI